MFEMILSCFAPWYSQYMCGSSQSTILLIPSANDNARGGERGREGGYATVERAYRLRAV